MVMHARSATAEALAEAYRARSRFLVERYQDELAGWDALIEQVLTGAKPFVGVRRRPRS